jgi:hypothetical protein
MIPQQQEFLTILVQYCGKSDIAQFAEATVYIPSAGALATPEGHSPALV